ncbi:hypothetical protein AVEN_134169-1 [Araneus ventricosus]|uniref:Uncharacterized protein n=1 Tax=Araneus ventricosus TaxID=182803 RepID=A0A4Y2W1C6_ARAVE|nr:hypothetical protein AVEN_134169-1 [Araneus ventricosus]
MFARQIIRRETNVLPLVWCPQPTPTDPPIGFSVHRDRQRAGVVLKFGEGVPTQVSSSSSDRDSKLRAPSQNSSRVASKRGLNITKLTLFYV